MFNFRFSFPRPRPVLALAGAMAASLGLQGCFESAEVDSPYSVPAGKSIETARLEIEPDGTVLILAQAGMFYSHKQPLTEEEKIPQLRNLESIVYRRTAGGWSATSFKNLQSNSNSLPILIPDAQGRINALVWNSTYIRRYRYMNGAWNLRPKADYPEFFNYMTVFSDRNWGRNPYLGIESDSALLTVENIYEGVGYGLLVRDGAVGKPFKLGTAGGAMPMTLHVGADYRTLVTVSSQYMEMKDNSPPQLHLFRWRRGDTVPDKYLLAEGNVLDCFISPYRGGTGLFALQDSVFHAFRLDAEGRPDSGTRTDAPMAAQRGAPMFAADPAGCYKGLEEVTDPERRVPAFIPWNTCREADTASLVLPLVADPKGYYRTTSMKVRLDASGRILAALVMTRGETDMDRGYSKPFQPSFLFFAELRDGKWTVETVPVE